MKNTATNYSPRKAYEPFIEPPVKAKFITGNYQAVSVSEIKNLVDVMLKIVGPEDPNTDGAAGSIQITGHVATAILNHTGWPAGAVHHARDKPVRLERNGKLEVWCDGMYIEGYGVRKLIHKVARSLTA